MVKSLGVCAAAVALLCCSLAGFASDTNWAMYLQAGTAAQNGVWTHSGSQLQIGVGPAAWQTPAGPGLPSPDPCVYCLGLDNAEPATVDVREYSPQTATYTWQMCLETRDGWNASSPITFAWFTYSGNGFAGTAWQVDIYANGSHVASCIDDGIYSPGGASAPRIINSELYMGVNSRTNYTITASLVPEPSSIMAILAGLAGIGGMRIRRKK